MYFSLERSHNATFHPFGRFDMIWRLGKDYDLSKFSNYERLKGPKIVKDLMKVTGWHEEVYFKQQTSSCCLAIFVSDYVMTI